MRLCSFNALLCHLRGSSLLHEIMAATDRQGGLQERNPALRGMYVRSQASSLRGVIRKDLDMYDFWGDFRYSRTDGIKASCWFHNSDSLGPETGDLPRGQNLSGRMSWSCQLRLKIIATAKHISVCTPGIRLSNTLTPLRRPCFFQSPPSNPADNH